jgi:hypothetical protein
VLHLLSCAKTIYYFKISFSFFNDGTPSLFGPRLPKSSTWTALQALSCVYVEYFLQKYFILNYYAYVCVI